MRTDKALVLLGMWGWALSLRKTSQPCTDLDMRTWGLDLVAGSFLASAALFPGSSYEPRQELTERAWWRLWKEVWEIANPAELRPGL